MLTAIDIRAFKAFGDPGTHVPLAPFTLVVGANGAGKTSILQAIEMVGMLSRGTLTEALSQRGWEYGDLVHLKSNTAVIGFRTHVLLEGGDELVWSLELGNRRRAGIASERIETTSGTVLLERTGRTMARRDENTGEMVDRVEQTLVSSWLYAFAEEDRERFPTLTRLAQWARGIRPYVVLDPLVLREPGRSHPDGLGIHGEGLPALLRALSPAQRDSAIQRARKHFSSLRDVRAIRSGESGATRLEVAEVWGDAELSLSARQVSDGLLRLLALSALHELEEPPTILMFDEIENGVHPYLLGAIIEMLRSLADAGIQVIATTHSPVAASFVGDAAEVLIVGREPDGQLRVGQMGASAKWAKLADAFAPGEAWYALGEREFLNAINK
ncbi:MAG TPA: ATP-binding protein [Solirubrobacteraceae bacterium]|nr:ATP-binding protein [Solirubrobacteraceae bacterium]